MANTPDCPKSGPHILVEIAANRLLAKARTTAYIDKTPFPVVVEFSCPACNRIVVATSKSLGTGGELSWTERFAEAKPITS